MIIDAPASNIAVSASWDRPDRDPILKLAAHPVALVGDAVGRIGILHGSITSMTPGLRLAGSVLPVFTREGDNLAIHRALDEAQPGDVLVINAFGETSRACFGDILGELCVSRGIAGVVIDGATRDIAEIRSMGLPTFARGTSPAGPFKNGPGTVGAAVACGSVVCSAGDVILGDDDGLLVIPADRLEEILSATERQAAIEDGLREKAGFKHN